MLPKTSIKTIKDFISEEDARVLREYNDELLSTKLDLFFVGNAGKRPVLQFGRDNSQKQSHQTTDGILLPEIKELLTKLFTKTIDTIYKEYKVSTPLHLCSFWFAKQLPGANVAAHDDTDEGANVQFKYSAVLYLNTLASTGSLDFIDLGYSVKPELGDLVIFPSQGTGLHEVKPIDQTRYTIPMWFTDNPEYAF
jgi:hypothetical protein